MSRSPGIIDRAEAQRLQLKFSGSNRPKRKKEREEINWRADPSPQAQPSCLSGGYKSIKHKWISTYLQSGTPQAAQPLGAHESEGTELRAHPGSLLDGDQAGPSVPSKSFEPPARPLSKQRVQSGNTLSQADKRSRPDPKQTTGAEPRQSGREPDKNTSDMRGIGAPMQSSATLADEKLRKATKQARKEAEEELTIAAELDRGAMAQKSLRKELIEPEILEPLEIIGNNEKRPGNKQTVKKPSGQSQASGDKSTPQRRPQSAQKRSQSGQKRKATEAALANGPVMKRSGEEKHRRSGVSSQSKENVAENEGKTRKVISPQQEEGSKQRNFFSTHSKAIDSHPLVQVLYVDGRESEHLGELDLNQLDSFRDLWLTIRSAFSARLPKGDFKLVYKDSDDDLMMHKSEPWTLFKSTATTLILMSK